MAAKWEFEDNKNIPNSRTLLQRGLRVNPSSKQLWLEVNKTLNNNNNNNNNSNNKVTDFHSRPFLASVYISAFKIYLCEIFSLMIYGVF